MVALAYYLALELQNVLVAVKKLANTCVGPQLILVFFFPLWDVRPDPDVIINEL